MLKSNHLFLGGNSSLCTGLRPFVFRFGGEGLFDVLKCFKQLANTLGYRSRREFVLVGGELRFLQEIKFLANDFFGVRNL